MRKVTDIKGFTLIEMILASVLLTLAVLTLGTACTRFLGSTQLNREYETALALADRQLVMIDYIGAENFLKAGVMEGEIQEATPSYRWQAACEEEGTGNLYTLGVTISWMNRNRIHSVKVETLTNGTGKTFEETGKTSGAGVR